MRKAIASHMVRSKQISPHVTTVMEADMKQVDLHRENIRVNSVNSRLTLHIQHILLLPLSPL